MTPQERNQLIDEVIEYLFFKGIPLSICGAVKNTLFLHKNLSLNSYEALKYLNIPLLNNVGISWWPSDDLESRILFLKSVKTCHK